MLFVSCYYVHPSNENVIITFWLCKKEENSWKNDGKETTRKIYLVHEEAQVLKKEFFFH